jgi:hypothetical protein
MPHRIKQTEIIEAETNLVKTLQKENNLSLVLLPAHIHGLKTLANIFLEAEKSPRVENNNKPPRVDN